MEKIILTTQNELQEIIRSSINQAFKENPSSTTTQPKEVEFLNFKETCTFLNLSGPTLYNKTSQKLLPFYKTGKKLLFKKSELIEFLNPKF